MLAAADSDTGPEPSVPPPRAASTADALGAGIATTTPSGARGRFAAPAAKAAAKPVDDAKGPFGREGWPPPPGSSYDAFLDWASEGGVPFDGDVELAIRLWAGEIEHPGPAPVATSAPAP